MIPIAWMVRRFVTLGLLLTLIAPLCAQATTKRPITVEDVWKVKRLGKPNVSPDGQWVVVDVASHSMDDNSTSSDMWLLSTDGKTRKQLTTFKANNTAPVWSPDGSVIAFISKRASGVPQIHVISPNIGEARPVSRLPMTPSGLKWSPDGKTIYCVVWTWPDAPDDDSYRKKVQARKADKVQAYVIDDALFRVWDHWIADGKRPVVFAIDVATGKHRNLFAKQKLSLPVSGGSAADYDISPDGKEICFTAESTRDLGMDYNSDLYVMPVDRFAEPKNITPDNLANDSEPVYAPDGKSIAFLRQTIKYFYADRLRIMIHDRTSGRNREITANFDRSCHHPQWAPNSGRLFFEAEDKGYYRLFTVSATGNEVAALTSGFSDQSASLSRDGRRLVFLRSNFGLPAALYAIADTEPSQPQRLDAFNIALVSQWKLGETKEIYFRGADADLVQMWIIYPPDFDATKKWPLLQIVHGGPHNGITTNFHYRWNLHLFASKGYVVACINYHGSSGFGQRFTDSITGDLGTKPMIDIMKGTDWMEQQPYIDKSRTVAAGASYGGYMMAWLNGHTNRFKAMVCHAGVYNWHSMMASDFVRGRERSLGALPGGDLTKIDRQTPQRYAANFKTPTLVTHGEKDYRVPVTQGFEYYNTLRMNHVPARLVYFPDENHWITKPQNARLWQREFFAWLDKYVGHGPTK